MRFDEALHQGIALQKAGKPTEAQAIYRQLLAIKPDDPLTLYLSGLAAHEAGDLQFAMEQISRARELHPAAADVHYGMGNLLLDLGRTDEALASYRAVLERRPNFLPALKKIMRLTQDESAVRDVLAQDPNDTESLITLGNAQQSRHNITNAIASFAKAIEIDPSSAAAHHNLANALSLAGRNDEAIEQYKKALELHPNPLVHGHLLLAMHYSPRFTPEAIFAEHRNWAKLYAEPLRDTIRPHGNDRSPDRRLKIGYVSGDFRAHAVLFFLEPILRNHDRTNFEIFCYSDVSTPDPCTARYKSAADEWRDISRLSDEQATDVIRADNTDILVDLGGHTGTPRLLIFARRPAPIQVTYLGYPDTTGLSAIDYRLTDAIADPPGQTESLHKEQLIRLPGSFLSYQPPPNLPEPIPRTADQPITFGSFNNLAKITPDVIATWAAILHRVPDSRLILKNYSLQDEAIRHQLTNDVAAHGINPNRLELLAPIWIHSQHVEIFGRIDIALDPFPYNGTTSTFEALWMGVPVITLAGRSHVSRVGASLLTNANLPDLIATSKDVYISTAQHLAADRDRLREIRLTLRRHMRQSILTDITVHTRHLEDAYRQMWTKFLVTRASCPC